MSLIAPALRQVLESLRKHVGVVEAARRLGPHDERALPQPVRTTRSIDHSRIAALWRRLTAETDASDQDREAVLDPSSLAAAPAYQANIEGFAGTLKLPMGVIGPMRVNGLHAQGDFFVPLATTEAALVASYGRGAKVATLAGGVTAAVTSDGVMRTPAFVFADILDVGLFVDWVVEQSETLKQVAEATTRHGKLVGLEPWIDANVVFLRCRYTTGDAAGQNMVTIATDALCRFAVARAPRPPKRWYIEGNFSGDKKASFLGFISGRGRKVTATVTLPKALVERHLGTTVAAMLDYARIADLGARLTGQIGAQGHIANGLAAFYLATGQDAACVAESAIGSTRMEARDDDLFMSVTLPSIIIGSVGGGTGLPSQSAGLNILGLKGTGNANALAEVAAATCLAGEISIMAAIAAGHFVRAHHKLARGR